MTAGPATPPAKTLLEAFRHTRGGIMRPEARAVRLKSRLNLDRGPTPLDSPSLIGLVGALRALATERDLPDDLVALARRVWAEVGVGHELMISAGINDCGEVYSAWSAELPSGSGAVFWRR